MGTSTDGQICFGYVFDDGYEFPWSEEEESGGGDIETWWRNIRGFSPSQRPDWGNDSQPNRQQVMDTYFAERNAFDIAHPLPVKLVNYCSHDYPMYILAVPATYREASRGYPEAFTPSDLHVTEEGAAKLKAFIEEFALKPKGEPQWWLSSYWG